MPSGDLCRRSGPTPTTILFDPGTFSHGFEGITGLTAILITHQHPDHADPARLPALVDANPEAALYADPQTAAQLGAPGRPSTPATSARRRSHRPRRRRPHAVIHPEIPVIDNISYLVGDGDHRARSCIRVMRCSFPTNRWTCWPPRPRRRG